MPWYELSVLARMLRHLSCLSFDVSISYDALSDLKRQVTDFIALNSYHKNCTSEKHSLTVSITLKGHIDSVYQVCTQQCAASHVNTGNCREEALMYLYLTISLFVSGLSLISEKYFISVWPFWLHSMSFSHQYHLISIFLSLSSHYPLLLTIRPSVAQTYTTSDSSHTPGESASSPLCLFSGGRDVRNGSSTKAV